ncbi:MAG: outer-membrane lipoprotein carrier protein LolA [Gemmatimonadota bacterium]|nr:outer-membrane lipoprotein carrier protein LolA [Gemmatimonadota bacterium]
MHSTKSDAVLITLACLGAGALTACGPSPDDRREALRADAEREFGRPAPGAAPPQAGERPPGGTEAPEGAGPPVGPGAAGSTDPEGGDPGGTDPGGTDPASVSAGDPAPDSSAGPPAGAETQPLVPPPTEEPGVTPAPANQEPGASALLADADEAYSGLSSLRAAFVQRVEVPLLDRTTQGHGVWLQAGRDRFRMDFAEPPDDLFVADGEFLWLYQPSANPGQVLQCELAEGQRAAGGADVLARILSEARESYDARYEGTAIVSGARTHVIELTPSGPSEYRQVRIWIADGDRLVRRFRIVEENETIRTVTLAELEPNVSLDRSLFAFSMPDGADVFDC